MLNGNAPHNVQQFAYPQKPFAMLRPHAFVVNRRRSYRVILITLSGNQMAISGAKQSTTTARVTRTTNGSRRQITSPSGTLGAMFLITKMFNPTADGSENQSCRMTRAI